MALAPSAIKKQRSKDAQLVREVVTERRRASIKARESDRVAAAALHDQRARDAQHATSYKYPKRDIVYLKQIFDEYDIDGSGRLERTELLRALTRQKEHAQHLELAAGLGEKRGVFLVDFSESLFRAMDANADGHIEFAELLPLIYPSARESELLTMLSWVSDEAPKQKLEDFELSGEQKRQIRSMFRLYDKDRSGTISPMEFRQAMKRCGLDETETDAIFAEADIDENQSIDFQEFSTLMRRAFFEGEDLTPAMLYGKI